MLKFAISSKLEKTNRNYYLLYNTEQIRSLLKLSQENFCCSGRGRDDKKQSVQDDKKQSDKIKWDWNWEEHDDRLKKEQLEWSFETVSKLQLPCLHISPNTYSNYISGTNFPKEATIIEIVSDLNALRARIPELRKDYIPEEITVESLTKGDLFKNNSGIIFEEKFFGQYICYYNSTSVDNKHQANQYGVIQISKGSHRCEFSLKGVFSLKDEKTAKTLYDAIDQTTSCEDVPKSNSENTDKKPSFEDILENYNINSPLFSGQAYLSPNLLWCNLSNSSKTEHISISFDLSTKITTKYPAMPFFGDRGIALSQTSGQSSQSTAFPMVILREPATVCPNEMDKFLCFDFSQIDDSTLTSISSRVDKLIKNLLANGDFDETLKNKLISTLIEHEILDLLRKHVFNSHYYTVEERNSFYEKIVRPIRRPDEYRKSDYTDED